MLRIAVKHIPGGAFSTFVHEQLKAGDVLELLTPTGNFATPLDPLNTKHYVAIAAGSGITPILSMLQTTLEIETRFALIYGNRSKDTTMFRRELDELESRYSDRLEVLRVLSRDPLHTPDLSGRIDRDKLDRWLTSTLAPETVDEWFLCSPLELVTLARKMLVQHGVETDHIHVELFFGYDTGAGLPTTEYPASTVTFMLSGKRETAALAPVRASSRRRCRSAATHHTLAWAARAGRAAPSCSTEMSRWTTTLRSARRSSTRATFSPANRTPPPRASPSTTMRSREQHPGVGSSRWFVGPI